MKDLTALNLLMAERMTQPFAWGSNDCCLFAADAIKAQTGNDPAETWRGTYFDEKGGLKLMKKLGGLAKIATKALGKPLAYPMLAAVGDIGLIPDGPLAVCVGAWFVAPRESGLAFTPLDKAVMAWRV